MKTFNGLFVTIVTLLLSAQVNHAQDIDGIKICGELTRQQIIQKYGEPQKYQSSRSEIGEGLFEEFEYENLCLVIDSNILTSFGVIDKNIKTLTSIIPGGVRVGEKYSSYKSTIEKMFVLQKQRKSKNGKYDYYEYYSKKDDSTFLDIATENDIIFRVYAEWCW